MPVIWLNGAVGSGKTSVGRALAAILPGAAFVDGDDHAGPAALPARLRWRMAVTSLLRLVARRGGARTLVVAYPLTAADHCRIRAACARAHRALTVVTLATPLPITLRGRGPRRLDAAERARARAMHSQGYHRRRFAGVTLANATGPASRTARRIARLLRAGWASAHQCQPTALANTTASAISRAVAAKPGASVQKTLDRPCPAIAATVLKAAPISSP